MKNPDDTVEGRLGNLFNETRETLRRRRAECNEQVRRSPAQALLVAAGIGYAASKIPLGRIIGVAARLFFALIRPAAILFLMVKVYDLVNEKRKKSEPITLTGPPKAGPPF